MNLDELAQHYNFKGRTAVLTGGTGVLCGEMAQALAGCGANVVLLVRDQEKGARMIQSFGQTIGQHLSIQANVLDRSELQNAAEQISANFDRVDILLNGAGGNQPGASTNPQSAFFDLPAEALRSVSDLNLLGTILPCQVFGKQMALQKAGIILNIASLSGLRPLTRVPAYSAAKAALSNFTQWLAVHMAQEYSPEIRVNAIAPGFFLTDQNRFLLTDEASGDLTPRGRKILEHTPMARFGQPSDLLGATLWLLSPLSAFVTGAVIPVDGGFSAFSGV